MDPEANLAEQRRLVRQMLKHDPDNVSKANIQRQLDRAARLAELVEALDGWISNGGFLPKAWSKGR